MSYKIKNVYFNLEKYNLIDQILDLFSRNHQFNYHKS